MHRPLRNVLTCLLVLGAAMLLVAGCGSDSSDTDKERKAGTTPAKESSSPDPIEADLKIVIERVGGKEAGIQIPVGMMCTKSIPATCRGEVVCPAAETDSTQLPKICDWLAKDGYDALTMEPSTGVACTQQFGGPEIAKVTGTFDGQEINRTFTRSDGCQIANFDAVSVLWNGPDAAAKDSSGGGAAAGSCPAGDPTASAPSKEDLADDTVCATPAPPVAAPDEVSDPPSAFEG